MGHDLPTVSVCVSKKKGSRLPRAKWLRSPKKLHQDTLMDTGTSLPVDIAVRHRFFSVISVTPSALAGARVA